MNQQDSWETTEIFNHLSHGEDWPFEVSRRDEIDSVADQLRVTIYQGEEGPEALYQSFKKNGGDWNKVNWTKLAECMMADCIGEDWATKFRLNLDADITGRSFSDIAKQLHALAKEIGELEEDYDRDSDSAYVGSAFDIEWVI